MRINTRVCYAIRMMAGIARRQDGQPVALKDIAERQRLPRMYLLQLARPLKRAALLKSVWGNKGGYSLARPASEITLLEIMEAADGPMALLDCVLDSAYCERADYCECVEIWREINEAIVKTLEQYTLADLIEKGKPPAAEAGALCRIGAAPGGRIDGNGKR
jgi:Rrf2 family protein